ncbi:MAG TPA: PAS domain S-box protein [Polyangiaceae bacterium]|nr:PAS domain S-box protein [Polyangiaceae bacterium]
MATSSVYRLVRSAKPYSFAVLGVIAATLLRMPLESLLHGRAPYAFYFLPILWLAWYGGVGPTILAIVLSLISAWEFVVPQWEPGYYATIPVFLAVTAGMVALARAARSLRDAQYFLASVVASSDDAIITKSLDGIIQSWNTGAQRLYGYAAHEVMGKPISILIPPEHQGEEIEILQRLRRGERIDHFETVRLAKDGRRIDVSLTVSPVRDSFGEIIGASKIARDISDRKRTAETIAAEREWLSRTLVSIGDGVIATDAEGRVAFLNPVAERLTGWTGADARGRLCDEVFHIISEQTRQVVESPVARVLRLGTVAGLANGTVLISKDGSERPIDDSGAPILGGKDEIRGVVLVFRDISERRRTEAERRNAVKERERLLEAERAARNEAEHANRSKDEFVAMISHELRTPLNAIMGWTHILKGKPQDLETISKGIEVIERNARAQEKVVADLLDMSRIISGKLRLDVSDVDLIALIKTAVETTRPAADAKGISVDCTLDPSVAASTGDPTRLQQCVWNLLSNAIKFTPQGGRVMVKLGRAGSHVEISVSDNGIGIAAEFLPFLFDRFRQVDVTLSRRSGGLGLGLAIVKQLAELHGGHVRVESAGEGQGATFTLALPVRALRTGPAAKGTEPDQDRQLQQIKVLLVEDEVDNQEVLRTLLEQHQATVVVASSAPEALELLKRDRPHIVVSDVGLPEIDGYELIQRIRRQNSEAEERIPAIALTAHASPDDRTKALRAGFQAHIAKPVQPGELVATIASLTGLVNRQASTPTD